MQRGKELVPIRPPTLVDLTDDEARLALPLKWGIPDDVLPAWVAEMDYAPAEPIIEAVQRTRSSGALGYPRFEPAAASWARRTPGSPARHFGWEVDPDHVLPGRRRHRRRAAALDVLQRAGRRW